MPTLGFNQTAPEEWKETLSKKGRNLLQGDRSLEHAWSWSAMLCKTKCFNRKYLIFNMTKQFRQISMSCSIEIVAVKQCHFWVGYMKQNHPSILSPSPSCLDYLLLAWLSSSEFENQSMQKIYSTLFMITSQKISSCKGNRLITLLVFAGSWWSFLYKRNTDAFALLTLYPFNTMYIVTSLQLCPWLMEIVSFNRILCKWFGILKTTGMLLRIPYVGGGPRVM